MEERERCYSFILSRTPNETRQKRHETHSRTSENIHDKYARHTFNCHRVITKEFVRRIKSELVPIQEANTGSKRAVYIPKYSNVGSL
jgi:hypothetical protein